MATVIATRGLRKRFGRTVALDGLDLEVASGEVHGFLGPNGAGKTTTLRILLGLLRADGGQAQLLGGDPWRDAVALHRRLAYVPGDVEVWPNLTGGETIDLLGRLRGQMSRLRRDELCERFDLDPTKKGRTYSRGNRQKVALIAALMSDVELLLLDEPTAGLDPLMEAVFQRAVRDLRAAGRTVLLSSHILAQVEALADRVAIIRHGRIVETGSLGELRHLTRTTITAELDDPTLDVAGLPGVTNPSGANGTVRFEVDAAHLDTVMQALTARGLRAMTAQPPTLEQLLLRYYDDAADAPGSPATSGSPMTAPGPPAPAAGPPGAGRPGAAP